jgi:hypothetical protein
MIERNPLTPPRGWITVRELLDAVPQIKKSNLGEWRTLGVFPFEPLHIHVAGKPGSESFYDPRAVPLLRRLDELRRASRDPNRWLWTLWLEGHPVDIKKWVLARLAELEGRMSSAKRAMEKRAAEGQDSLIAPATAIAGRVRNTESRGALTDWILRWGAGGERPKLAAAAPELIGEATFFDLFTTAAGLTAELPLKGPGGLDLTKFADLGLPFLVAQFQQIANSAESEAIEQARRDWRSIADIAEMAASVNWNAASPLPPIGAKALPPSWAARKAKSTRRRPPPDIIALFLPEGLDDLPRQQRAELRAFAFCGVILLREILSRLSADHMVDEFLGIVRQWIEAQPSGPEALQ